MSEPYVPEPAPERSYYDPMPPRCPECGVLLRRVSIDEWRCPEHSVVRPYYGNPREDEER